MFNKSAETKFVPVAVGQATQRVDGRAKVTGGALYTAEHSLEGLLYGVVVGSAISSGSVTSIDTESVMALPGVVAVITPETAPRIGELPEKTQGIQYSGEGGLIEMMVPMQDNSVSYAGQAIAVVVAGTFEQAIHAAEMLHVEYRRRDAELNLETASRRSKPASYCGMEPLQLETGDPAKAYDAAAIRIERTYETPVHHHNAIEMLSTIAKWETKNGDEHLLLYDTTRVLKSLSAVIAHCLDVPESNIKIVVKFLGGSFGSKAWMFGNTLLAAACARKLGRPLKIAFTRQQMFELNGHRPATRQVMRLGASRTGRIASLRHEAVSHTSMVSGYPEPSTGMTMMMYGIKNLAIAQEIRHLNLPTPMPMRGVGVIAGGWALESLLDELAHELEMDPIDLRLANEATKGPFTDLPFSSKHLRECFEKGGEIFGWKRRKMQPGLIRSGNEMIGFGVASSTLPAVLDDATARITLFADGTAKVRSATHEIGNGAYTVFKQIAADAMSMPIDAVEFDLGDSTFPDSPITAGSRTTASVGAAVLTAGANLLSAIKEVARHDPNSALFGLPVERIVASNASLSDNTAGGARESYSQVLRQAGRELVTATGVLTPDRDDKKFELHSFGAIFAEVRVDLSTGVVRVPRLTGVFDVGRVINPLTARSQLMGGMIAGLGAALMEESYYDPYTGRAVIRNLADYHIPCCADTPDITVETLGIPDEQMGLLGARGLGELGTNNVPAAIGNAIFNATGKRLRNLPLTPDKFF
ncbi:xanthine dehydrogenase family protein molybdopterin-binding subunit [Burkholderia sp. PAMC 26561]|uniref:xanthine dehydrogenase family protein molybdopterin-binding subunit n=1 Tax=Burkholderia sp. PAMC 26561 TaxID=1795043 RepID=UPI00076B1CAB|nr:xanthine dehydrogenase family protein molybdopterin-binding subunit [Burkholderia sp. PAMC 26561]AME26947.1 hypothetical protein AXG89_23530 [Burkholderia sp. PAMC 26561]AME27907.1 hypothetical protein AXG89_29155 [Burkholderia sp. PAMC 26561]